MELKVGATAGATAGGKRGMEIKGDKKLQEAGQKAAGAGKAGGRARLGATAEGRAWAEVGSAILRRCC